MSEPDTVADLDPGRVVYVKPSGNVGSATRAHLYNDPDACWYTGDLRAAAGEERAHLAAHPEHRVETQEVSE